MDGTLRRRTRVDADAAYRWVSSFEDADLGIQRALVEQRVTPAGPRAFTVDRVLDFGEGPFRVRIDVRLDPPRRYHARVHAKEGAFDMTFAFEPAEAGSDIVVTVHGPTGALTADDKFRAQVLRNVAQNFDDYVPAMERELLGGAASP